MQDHGPAIPAAVTIVIGGIRDEMGDPNRQDHTSLSPTHHTSAETELAYTRIKLTFLNGLPLLAYKTVV